MLKDKNIRKNNYENYKIKDEDIIKEIDDNEFYFVEVDESLGDMDYHSSNYDYYFKGVILNFHLNNIDTIKYFGKDFSEDLFPRNELISIIEDLLKENNMFSNANVDVINNSLKIIIPDRKLDNTTLDFCGEVLNRIRKYYSDKGVHITRMFGSYVLLKKVDGELKAVKATPIPIKYCPLMIKLLREVGGECAEKLIQSLHECDLSKQPELMCELINETVIKTGYFDTNRSLNSCDANVLFGASETLFSGFKKNMLDAAVIVSNNLGTIITTNAFNTQGAVKRMTGLFYTSSSEEIVSEAKKEGIIPVFPYTGAINQLIGVKEAIKKGYKRIAVTFAAHDNKLLELVSNLEKEGIIIYKFGLCSTGIDEETAKIMRDNADIIWSCASKYVKEYIDCSSVAQVGVKIPVHIMTEKGWNLVKNHLQFMSVNEDLEDIVLCSNDEKPVFLNSENGIKKVYKKELRKCIDCPHPCV